MSNYTRLYDFSVKDALATGDANKKIKGSEVDDELDAVVTSSATKANKIASGTNGAFVTQDSNGDIADGGTVISTFAKTVLDDTDAAAARTTVGVPAVAGSPVSGNLVQHDGSGDLADAGYSAAELVALMARKNYALNPDGYVDQQAAGTYTAATTPANSDDSYMMDQWILLSDGNDILDVGVETTVKPTGRRSSIKLDIETADKRAGILQPIEAAETAELAGKSSVTFSAQVYVASGNSTVDTVRLVLAAWESTADSITSDIVSSWGVEGAAPTLIANWTQLGTTTATPSADTWTEVTLNADLSSGTINNLALFVMIENGDGTVGDLVYVSDVRLVVGAAGPCRERPFAEELALCERYYEKTYNLATAPGTATANGAVSVLSSNLGAVYIPYHWRTRKRTAPSIAVYSTNTGASGKIYDGGGADRAATVNDIGESGFYALASGVTTNAGMRMHTVGNARL